MGPVHVLYYAGTAGIEAKGEALGVFRRCFSSLIV